MRASFSSGRFLWPGLCACLLAAAPVLHAAQPADSASPTADLLDLPPRMDLPVLQILDPARTIEGSTSLGFTNEGALRNSVRVPHDGPAHRVLSAHRTRDTHHTSREVRDLLLSAAERTHRLHPDTRVGIGNLSVRDGGRIRWSRSHQNGRDADIAFIYTDAAGRVVDVPTLVPVLPDGRARSGQDLVFDVPRNWTLVESLLLADTHGVIQWLFIQRNLREALLDHAAALPADPDVITRAAAVLHQPGDSAPHHDHFHLRITCTTADLLEGCVHWGPTRPWMDLARASTRRRVEVLLTAAPGLPATDRDAALSRIERMHPRHHADLVAEHVSALPDPADRLRLIALLVDLDQPSAGAPLLSLTQHDSSDEVREAAARAMGRILAVQQADALAQVAFGRDMEVPQALRLTIARALGRIPPEETVASLVEARVAEEGPLADALEQVLRRATGQRPPAGQAADLWWQEWCAAHCTEARDGWLERTFVAAGYVGEEVEWGSLAAAAGLVDALLDEREEVAFNADRLLGAWLGIWSPVGRWTPERRHAWWSGHVAEAQRRAAGEPAGP